MSSFDSLPNKLAFRKTLFDLCKTLVLLSIVVASVYFFFGFDKPFKQTIKCNAEKIVSKRGQQYLKDRRSLFGGAELQSKDFAHSYEHSVKLDMEHPKGLSYTIESVDGDEDLWISVWRYHPEGKQVGKLACRAGSYYQESSEVKERQESGWEKLFIRAYLPLNTHKESLEVFCIHEGTTPIYFDDLFIDFRREEKSK